MNITVTDGYTLNPGDLSWANWEKLGKLTVHDFTKSSELLERLHDTDILIANKTPISAATIAALPRLKYIGVLATGYNNIDVKAAKERQIPVCNVVGYGSKNVAQHVFSLILELKNQVGKHNLSVQAGDWGNQPHFCYTLSPITELAGKTMGIYGFGNIGREIAKIGRAFGMKIIVNRRNMVHPDKSGTEGGKIKGITYVSPEELLKRSDILTLNASMSAENQGFINANTLKMMKPTALLINTARGGLVVEPDLKQALENGTIAGAGLDVLSVEPPSEGSILLGVKNCIITPHIAWASFEARQRLMNLAVKNLKSFLECTPINVVNG
jgi:glycerate dehydrogenase